MQWGPFEQGDIRDGARLDEVFAKHRPQAVVHFAALIEVGESVKHPGRFYENNVAGAISLIEAARRAGVDALVFSSTCATYGDPVRVPMDETHPQNSAEPLRPLQADDRAGAGRLRQRMRASARSRCATSTPPAPIRRGASASGTSRRRTPFR